jgi:hypothetical protein
MLRTDIFSYPMAGQQFLPFEWLSEVCHALVYRAAGLPGIAVFSGLLIGFTYALLVRFLLRRGVDPLLAFIVTMASAVGGAAHWLARPHLFTLLAIVVLLHLLEPHGRSRSRLWPFAALFAIWGNLHGGFLFGFIMIGLYLIGTGFTWLEAKGVARSESVRHARHLAAALGVAVLATLINPSGIELLTHLVGALRQREVVNNTAEYLSPDFHGSTAQIFLVTLLLVIAVLALAGRRPSWARLVVLLANVAFALIARRNIPLFSIVVLPLLALEYDREWRHLPEFGMRRVFARDEGRRRAGLWSAGGLIVMCAIAFLHGPFDRLRLLPRDFDRRDFPIEAVLRAREAGLQGHLFNEFLWGGYLIHAWPEQKVFIDGGSYGDDMVRNYAQILFRGRGWRDAMRRWNIELVLVPTSSPLAAELLLDREWVVWHRDSTAVLLQRTPPAATVSAN